MKFFKKIAMTVVAAATVLTASTVSMGEAKAQPQQQARRRPDMPIMVDRMMPPATRGITYNLNHTRGSNKMPGMMGITDQPFDLTTAAVSTKVSDRIGVGAMVSTGNLSPNNPMPIGRRVTEGSVAIGVGLNRKTSLGVKFTSGNSHRSFSVNLSGKL